MTTTPDMEVEPPLVRALRLAAGLHEAFGLRRDDLAFLLTRWRDVAGVPVRDDVLTLVCSMVVRDAFQAQPPITREEAVDITTDAAKHFSTLAIARHEVARYAKRRNASAAQCIRLDSMVRKAWHQYRADEVDHAAA